MKKPWIYLLLLCSSATLNGQQALDLAVQQLSVAQGLSQSSALSIYQDTFGLIWIGTRDGLNQYNGLGFKVFTNNPKDTFSIKGNIINSITGGEDGSLWIAHDEGVSRFDRQEQRFTNYAVEAGPGANPEIRHIALLDGQVWASGWAGTFRLDERCHCFTYPEVPSEQLLFFKHSAAFIKQDESGQYWLGTSSHGLYRFSKNLALLGHTAQLPGSGSTIRAEQIVFRKPFAFLATYGQGVLQLDGEGRLVDRWHTVHEYPSRRLSSDRVRTLSFDHNGQLWIGGFHGIQRLDLSTGAIARPDQFGNLPLTPDQSIRSLWTDYNGSLWIGTYHEGVLLYDAYLSRFQHVLLEDRPSSLAARGFVSALATDKQGRIFAGTEGGKLYVLDSQLQVLSSLDMGAIRSTASTIKSLHYDAQRGQLLVGTLSNGLFAIHLDGQQRITGQAPVQLLSPTDVDLGIINQIRPYQDSLVWLLTDRKGGLHLFNLSCRCMQPYLGQDRLHQIMGRASARSAFFDEQALYLSTRGAGLIRLDLATGALQQHLAQLNFITASRRTKAGLWAVATHGDGLFLLDEAFALSRHLTTADGLQSNIVLNVEEDLQGKLWVATFNGIGRIEGEAVQNYHFRNGLPIREVNEGAFVQSATGRHFLVGGNSGIARLQPEQLSDNPFVPKAHLVDIQVFGQSFLSQIRAEGQLGAFRLAYHQHSISFELAALNYLKPENNLYQFRLLGLEEDWRSPSHAQIAGYTNLSPGAYEFQYRVANNDGLWSPEVGRVAFEVAAPPWRTFPAFALYGLLIALGFYLVRQNGIRTAKLKHELKLKALEKAKSDELYRMKIANFTDISHEIRTPLTLILNPLEDVLAEGQLPKQVRKKMAGVRYHIRSLLLLVNQLLEIRRIEMKKEQLALRPVPLRPFLDRVATSFLSTADRLQIRFGINLEEVPALLLMMDADRLEKILLNLLSNAFKFSEPGDRVDLRAVLSRDGGHWELTLVVSDTGQGIAEEDVPRIFDRFYQGKASAGKYGSGIGLSLVKYIVDDLMQGSIEVSSRLNEGSCFTVELPKLEEAKGAAMPTEGTIAQQPLQPEYAAAVYRRQATTVEYDRQQQQKTLLIVEDNEEMLAYMQGKLSGRYQVLAAATAEEGLEYVEHKDVDLIISDLMLPGMDGMSFCETVKGQISSSHIPVIMLTALQGEDVRLESLETGVNHYLAKPFVFKELDLIIRNALAQQDKLHAHYGNTKAPPTHQLPQLGKYDQALMAKVDELVLEHLDEPEYTIEQLSKDVNLSRVHLYRKIKAITGLSPTTYIRNFRIYKAAEMLAAQPAPISETAYSVGFQDVNYFSKCFKKMYNLTPSDYARGLR